MSKKESPIKGKAISRRAFLKISAKISAYVALLFSGVASRNARAMSDLESKSDRSGYGSGGYSQGEYPARIVLYLPFVTKESD